MPEFGFPAQYRQATLSRIISDLKDRSDDARVETVTERFADVTGALDGRVNELFQIEKSLTDLRAYGEVIAISESRSRVMQEALDNVQSASQNLTDTSDVLRTNGTTRDLQTLSNQARGELDTIVSQLNISFGGRTLFAGDEAGAAATVPAEQFLTDSTPFLEGAATAAGAYANLQAEFGVTGGLFANTFYLGGDGNAPRAEVAPGEVVDYTVRANEDPIRNVLFNVVVLASAYDLTNNIPADQRRELVEFASDGLRNAVSDTITVQARLGAAEARIATVKARNIASDASLTIAFNDLAGADAYDAAVELTQLEAQLEVAFATTSRLASLSLASFR
ncbi:MAG: flagellin [Pseudomonadota bacterium]